MDDSNRIEEQENEMESGTALIPSELHILVTDADTNGYEISKMSDFILADQGAWGTAEGHTNELYEDYYISMYVPNVTEGQTHGVRIDSGTLMTHTSGGDTQKATNAWKDSYLVYTNAKFDPSVIDE